MPLTLPGSPTIADEFKARTPPPQTLQSLRTRIEQRRQLNQPDNANQISPSNPDWLQFSHPQEPITQQDKSARQQAYVDQNKSVNDIGNAASSAVAAKVGYDQEAAARRALAQNQALTERQQQLLSQFGNLDFSNGGSITNATGKRAQVIKFGEQLLGQPYQWGGGHGSLRVGPVDCSGLVRYAFGKAGITSVPGVSQSQMQWGTPSSISKLLPGDLVGVGHPAHHVAIWLGGGKILVAPHTGTNVQIQNIGNGSGWWGIHLHY